MTTRRLAVLALLAVAAARPAQAASYKATLLVRADDPRLERTRLERAYIGHPGGSAADGVRVALDEARLELDVAGTGLSIATVAVASAQAARAAAVRLEKTGQLAFVVDLPADWVLGVADAVKAPVLNVSEAADRLRESQCRSRLLHLIPSERMRADALAQTLTTQRWSQVLLLVGPSQEDAERAAVAQAALKRYGLKVAARRPFKLSADPRERDLASPRLLTAGLAYDAVWVVDSDGEFARGVPYRTVLPRPVVGDAGLGAAAWHAQFERFGAPQVSRRFARAAGRPMTGHDWAAWTAGKVLVAAAVAAPTGGLAAAQQAIATAEVDGSKGVSLSFRAWDGQLRQPMLLTDGQGVVATAPADGVLHSKNTLDTLGADQPEKLCRARP